MWLSSIFLQEDDVFTRSPTPVGTPTVNVSNQEAAARLFASYKAKNKFTFNEEELTNQPDTNLVGGRVEGTLVLCPSGNISDCSESGRLTLKSSPRRKKYSSLKRYRAPSGPDRLHENVTIARSKSTSKLSRRQYDVEENFIPQTPEIVIINTRSDDDQDRAHEAIDIVNSPDYEPQDTSTPKRKITHTYFTSLDASDRRKVFAKKESGAHSEINPYSRYTRHCRSRSRSHSHSQDSAELLMTESEKHHNQRRKIYREEGYTSCESSRRQRKHGRNRGLWLKVRSVPTLDMKSSYSSNDEFNAGSRISLQSRPNTKYFSKQSRRHERSNRPSSRHSNTNIRRSVSEMNKRRHNYGKNINGTVIKSSFSKTQSDFSLNSSFSERDFSMKYPIRKSKSNDLNFKHAEMVCKSSSPSGWQDKWARHSFHATKGRKSNVKDPDEMLNIDQTQIYISRHNSGERVTNVSNETKLKTIDRQDFKNEATNHPKLIGQSFTDSVPSPVFLSVTDTDAGFSSSSKSYVSSPIRDNDIKQPEIAQVQASVQSSRTNSSSKVKDSQHSSRNTSVSRVKDSAYQTSQSSIEKQSLDLSDKIIKRPTKK